MTTDLGPTLLPRAATDGRPPQFPIRAPAGRWNESRVARLLVVDARGDRERLRDDLAVRGVHVTWAGSTLDGLVEFGRNRADRCHRCPRRTRGAGHRVRLQDPRVRRSVRHRRTRRGRGCGDPPLHRRTFGPIEPDARAYAVRVNGERISDLPLKESRSYGP
jgi:hypothetical protein